MQGPRDRARRVGAPADEGQAAQAKACRDFLNAADDYDDAVAALAWAQAWFDSRQGVSDGQLLFELYCARCHTQGWSMFDPTQPNSTRVLGLPGGGGGQGGGIAFNLRDGATIRRFGEGTQPGELGFDAQVEFINSGSEANKQYGNGGHRDRPHARLRQHAHRRDDRRDRHLRARRSRPHDVPRTCDHHDRRHDADDDGHDHDDRRVSGMGLVTLLAQHASGEKNLWDPTILGVLVVLSAVGLFCGSVYLLLGTNLGGRLGFLVAGACLTGFMRVALEHVDHDRDAAEQPEGAAARAGT